MNTDSVIGQQQVSDADDGNRPRRIQIAGGTAFASQIQSLRPSRMARVARLFRPRVADVDRVFESQPVRPLGELQAPGLPCCRILWTVAAIGRNGLAAQALMLAVMAAEASRELHVAFIHGVCVPADFHPGKKYRL